MQVEVFELEGWDVPAEQRAIEDVETKELIESLGLKGQQTFISGETLERFPYRKMTKDEFFVYSSMCPEKTAVESYSGELIPVRVLRVLQFAKSDLCPIKFTSFQIWHPEEMKVKDPVLVGIKRNSYWQEEIYILARWGEVLDTVENLYPVAKQMALRRYNRALDAIRAKVEALNPARLTDEELLTLPNLT